MKTVISLVFILLFGSFSLLNGQTVIGVWESYHPENNSPVAHIEIYEADGVAYARVLEILDESLMTNCENCTGNKKGQSITGMNVIWALKRKSDTHYKKGQILDPSSGKIYKCFVKLKDQNLLKVRAYAGITALGKTQYWSRISSSRGPLIADNSTPN